MEPHNSPTPVRPRAPADRLIDLGIAIGYHRAFGLTSNYCSAADARTLKNIRDSKLYTALTPSWEEFCQQHTTVCRKTVDAIIDRLEEFGENYFNISLIVDVSLEEYRALAPSVKRNSIEFDGESIPIAPEHAAKIALVIRKLRIELAQQKEPYSALRQKLDRCVGEVDGAVRRGVEDWYRDLFRDLLNDVIARLTQLAAKV